MSDFAKDQEVEIFDLIEIKETFTGPSRNFLVNRKPNVKGSIGKSVPNHNGFWFVVIQGSQKLTIYHENEIHPISQQ